LNEKEKGKCQGKNRFEAAVAEDKKKKKKTCDREVDDVRWLPGSGRVIVISSGGAEGETK